MGCAACGRVGLRLMLTARCRANMAHVPQSRPDYGLDFQVDVLQTFQSVPSSLASGTVEVPRLTDLDLFVTGRLTNPGGFSTSEADD